MKKLILLTRPIEDSLKLSESIKKLGFDVIISPLLTVKKIDQIDIIKKKIDIIFFTSKNGIRNFNNELFLNSAVLTVGKGTYHEAKSNGYKNIYNANGSTNELLILYEKKYKNEKFNILHPTSTDKNKILENYFSYRESEYLYYPVYKTIKKNSFPKNFKKFFQYNYGIIILFSIKTAECFLSEINKMGLKFKCKDKTLVVLSEKIKKKIRTNEFKKVLVLKKPNQENLLSLIANL